MDPLSLLCRLAASVPPPRHHTVRYAGVLAGASEWIAHRATRGARSARVQDARQQEAEEQLSDVGGPPRAHVRHRRARLYRLPGPPEVDRRPQRPGKHRLVSLPASATGVR